MPAKNSLKTYISNAYYHIYNRGVEKRIIFLDKQDYAVFLSYLKEYLLPKDKKKLQQALINSNLTGEKRDDILKSLRMSNFANEIILYAFCLMPNHFHLLIKQNQANSIAKFMNSLCTRYSMYFNKKYIRVGSLFQGVYKAVHIKREDYLLYITRYIHFQARKIGQKPAHPSSIEDYLGVNNTGWIKPNEILSYFSKTNPNLTYQSFMEQTERRKSFDQISSVLID
ncbi:MAG: transposase [Candidatus Microgenomates bacterium]